MRLTDESESAYFAFRAWLESGPVWSIAAAYRSVKGLPESETVKVPGYFNSWAARYEWQQRAAEWNAHIESLVAELRAARKQTVEQAADLQAIIEGEMETLREEIAKVRRIGGPPVDYSAELAAALESAARGRLMALGGVDFDSD